MPVQVSPNVSGCTPESCAASNCTNPAVDCAERASRTLTIGFVNNMQDGALKATEQQFMSLLESAAEGISVEVRLLTLPGIERSESAARYVSRVYQSTDDLNRAPVDALIVTGREPLTSNLADEPYWESFTRLVEWAQSGTISTLWSCLAAHAAVLYLDGIGRVRNGQKFSGVFRCTRVHDHPLIAGTPSSFKIPHSRWNGVPEDALVAGGYRILARAGESGVDSFVKQLGSLFVFFQGHPEYETNTLMLEYRRDVGRFLRGETETYPRLPRDYFDLETAAALFRFEETARSQRSGDVVDQLSSILEKARIQDSWRTTAAVIYRNWLTGICAEKRAVLETQSVATAHEHLRNAAPSSAGLQPPSTASTDSQRTATIC